MADKHYRILGDGYDAGCVSKQNPWSRAQQAGGQKQNS
jgi:hypothetical protein